MTMPVRSGRYAALTRVGYGLLAGALMMLGTGCGSQVSDAEFATALGRPTAAGPAGVDTPTAAAGAESVPVAESAIAPPVLPNSSSAASSSQPGGAISGATVGGTDLGAASSGHRSKASAETAAARPVAVKSVVKIGTIGPFSGVLGALTDGGPKTLAAWAAHTTANGGLNGHPVKVIVGDDQADPATALTLARRMVESDKIIAMVSNINVFGFAQIERYAREKNVPMIGGDAADPGWFTSTTTFPVSAAFSVQMIKGIQSHVDKGVRRVGVLYCVEVAAICNYLNDEVKKSDVGKYVVESYQVSLVAPSYTSQCLRMKQSGVDFMVLIMDTAGAARLAQNCATQGFKPASMILGLDANKDLPSYAALEGITIPGATFPTQARGVPAIEKFRQVMATYGPSIGESGVGALAWASAEMLARVARNLSDSPNSAELYVELWRLKNETLGGLIVPVTFSKGAPPQAKPCVFIWGTAGGKYTAPQGAKPFC